MNLLSLSNPVFGVYVIAATLMVLKMTGMAWLTVVKMMQVNGGFRSPEDAKRTAIANRNPHGEQLAANEQVERVRRIHHNDLENVPAFLVTGLLYVLTEPSITAARWLFGTYVVSRLLHFIAYYTARTHDTRATFWTIGVAVLMYMAAAALWTVAQSGVF